MLQTETKKHDAAVSRLSKKSGDSIPAVTEDLSTVDFNTKVGYCFNDMINGNVTDDYLITKYGQDVFETASVREMEYFNNLD
jgi:hypothetical protein